MTLSQKKIAAFGVFLSLFILQILFSITALYNLHDSHHVIVEEWEEFNRVQALEDLLDEQNDQLIAIGDGRSFHATYQSFKRLADISSILDEMVKEYGPQRKLSRTEHEKIEDSYLINIVGPLQTLLSEYKSAIDGSHLTALKAKEYSRRLINISHQIVLLRKSDAAFAQRALDRAKKAGRQTLRNSLIISFILFVALILWGIYFLINLNHQTQLEIFQQKIMTAGLLAQSLAHEIRNPLGVIKSAADLLAKRQGLDHESRELAGYMVEEVVRIDRLIKELLSLSRKKSEPREDSDIGQIMRSVLDLIGGKLKQTGVTVNYINKTEGLICYCVPGQIRQVILNLLLNALDVSPQNGKIEIITEKKDNCFVISIRDHGKGFPMQDKDKIFDLFYTTKESGFGIGLAVVKRIVDEHQGTIQVQSWMGQGSMFMVNLPLRT